jgi:hypothetical protein
MSTTSQQTPEPQQPAVYQIRLEGHLNAQWAGWFAGLTVTSNDNGETLITGPVADQSALFGLLKKVRDLGMPLISVNRLESGQTDTSGCYTVD